VSESIPQFGTVASLAGLSVVVAGETTPLVELRKEAMPAVDECVDRIVTSRPLIVTTFARVGLMADGAVHSIHRRHLAVKIVSPSDRVRLRPHNRMAFIAVAVGQRALLGSGYRLNHGPEARHEFMTKRALGIGSSSGFGVSNSKRRGVIGRPFSQSMVSRFATGSYLRVADRAVGDAVRAGRASRFVAHRAVPHRRNVQLSD